MSPLFLGIVASGISGHLTPPWEPAGAYDALATVTVPSGGAASISFAGIPTGYKHLEIRGISRQTSGGISQQFLRFNGDSSTAYSSHTLTGDGANAATAGSAGGSQNKINVGIKSGTSQTAQIFGASVITILDYAQTTKNKTTRTLSGIDANGSGYVWFSSGAWYNTTAVSSIQLISESDSFAEYSTFALYGVK